MGELIRANFGQRRENRSLNLGINPSDEPSLYNLSQEELVRTAIEREVQLKRTARSGAREMDFEALMTATIRVGELLTPEQFQEVYYASEEILSQERQK
jgi:hypothetical protein